MGLKRLSTAVVILLLGSWGCVSTRMSDTRIDHDFRNREYASAVERLKKGLEEQGPTGRDRILYLLDLGLTLHTLGQHEESNRFLAEAEKMSEIRDYTSLSAEAGSLLTGENVKDYRIEEFENVLINVYLSMNYALLGKQEDALIEARKVNRKLHLMVTEGHRKYQQNAFARYLSGILYEIDHDPENAYVDYKAVADLLPGLKTVGRDLWRLAQLTSRPEDATRWEKEFSLSPEDLAQACLGLPAARADKLRKKLGLTQLLETTATGEVIVLFENGISPIKKPHPDFAIVPKFYSRYNPVTQARVVIDGQDLGVTEVFHSIEQTAFQNLEEKFGGIIAKRLAGVATKVGVAVAVGKATDNPELGKFLAWILLLSDQADTRSWSLLPKDLQVARHLLSAGTHTLRLVPVGEENRYLERTIEVQAGKKIFVNLRTTP